MALRCEQQKRNYRQNHATNEKISYFNQQIPPDKNARRRSPLAERSSNRQENFPIISQKFRICHLFYFDNFIKVFRLRKIIRHHEKTFFCLETLLLFTSVYNPPLLHHDGFLLSCFTL